MPLPISDAHSTIRPFQSANSERFRNSIRKTEMPDFTFQLFEPHLGSKFQILINGQPALDLTLAEVEKLKVPGEVPNSLVRTDPFSLVFHGPLEPIAGQQIYEIGHAELGIMEIFLVVLGPDKATRQKMQYQAVFN